LLKNLSPKQEFADSVFYHESAEARMRGAFVDQGSLFSYISPEARVPANPSAEEDPRACARCAARAQPQSFETLCERRPSIDRSGAIAERLAAASVLRHSIGTPAVEQLDYNLLYRWFVGLSPDDPVWDPTVFTKNRDRLQNGEVFAKFMSKLLNHPQVKPLLSDKHFSVDGTLIEAWASQTSFLP
jgi:hypothetical protein